VIPANRRAASLKGANLRKGEQKKIAERRKELAKKHHDDKEEKTSTAHYWLGLFILLVLVAEFFLNSGR